MKVAISSTETRGMRKQGFYTTNKLDRRYHLAKRPSLITTDNEREPWAWKLEEAGKPSSTILFCMETGVQWALMGMGQGPGKDPLRITLEDTSYIYYSYPIVKCIYNVHSASHLHVK